MTEQPPPLPDDLPADLRSFIECQTDSVVLRGGKAPWIPVPPVLKEAAPLEGDVELGDRVNMVFSGTAVARGRGRAVVTGTGMATEMGNVATLLSETVEQPTRCELQQAGAREDANAAVQVVTWRAWLPPDAPARGWDALRLDDGRLLELEGDAWAVRNPRTGVVHHVEAFVRGTE